MRSVTLPILKRAWGLNGLSLTVDAAPDTGRVHLRVGGLPMVGAISQEMEPEDLERVAEVLQAEATRARQLAGECVGLVRQCDNCGYFDSRPGAQIGTCTVPGRMADTVRRDRPACTRWQPED